MKNPPLPVPQDFKLFKPFITHIIERGRGPHAGPVRKASKRVTLPPRSSFPWSRCDQREISRRIFRSLTGAWLATPDYSPGTANLTGR